MPVVNLSDRQIIVLANKSILLLRFQSEKQIENDDRSTINAMSIVVATYPSYWPFCLKPRRSRDCKKNFSKTGWSTRSAASDRDWPSPAWPFSNPCWPFSNVPSVESDSRFSFTQFIHWSRTARSSGGSLLLLSDLRGHGETHQQSAVKRGTNTTDQHTTDSWTRFAHRNREFLKVGPTVSPPPTVGRPAPPGWLNTLLPVPRPLLCLVLRCCYSLRLSLSLCPYSGPPLSSSNRPLPWRVWSCTYTRIVLVVVIHRRRYVGLYGVVDLAWGVRISWEFFLRFYRAHDLNFRTFVHVDSHERSSVWFSRMDDFVLDVRCKLPRLWYNVVRRPLVCHAYNTISVSLSLFLPFLVSVVFRLQRIEQVFGCSNWRV